MGWACGSRCGQTPSALSIRTAGIGQGRDPAIEFRRPVLRRRQRHPPPRSSARPAPAPAPGQAHHAAAADDHIRLLHASWLKPQTERRRKEPSQRANFVQSRDACLFFGRCALGTSTCTVANCQIKHNNTRCLPEERGTGRFLRKRLGPRLSGCGRAADMGGRSDDSSSNAAGLALMGWRFTSALGGLRRHPEIRFRRHRLDDHLLGAGADDDHSGPGPVLWRHGAQEECAGDPGAKLRRHLPRSPCCG